MATRLGIASCLTAALVMGCTACSIDTRKYYVSSPLHNAVLLAPDLPTLNALLSADTPPPSAAISVPNGTKGRMLDTEFLRDGRLVDPRGLRGWILALTVEYPRGFNVLRPDFWYL
jgi:hypothetical protein